MCVSRRKLLRRDNARNRLEESGRGNLTLHCRHLPNEDLLVLLELLDKLNGHLERLRHEVRGRQRKPLGERDVGDSVRLVDLDPDEVLVLGRVLNVVSARR